MATVVTQVGIIILAAGQSSRLGKPKQLLPFRGTSLLRHAVQAAIQANIGPVVVVLGANFPLIAPELNGLGVLTVNNHEWPEGMSSSLRAGLSTLIKAYPLTEGAIFMVCDQPFISKSVLLCLMEVQHKTGKPVVAAVYAGKMGTPVLFHSSFFGLLAQLKGDKGARSLIAEHKGQVEVVPFEKGAFDIDTQADYGQVQGQ